MRGDHELSHPFVLKHPRSTDAILPFTGQIDDWLTRLEVYTPFDADRIRDLERWRRASDRAHGEALVGLLSVVDAMRVSLQAKPPLAVRFPKPYRPNHCSQAPGS